MDTPVPLEHLRGAILKEGPMDTERVAGTFRSPWVTRRVVLTDYGVYVFELPNARQRKTQERGALILVVPIETINGLMLQQEKKKSFIVLATFLKDHRFLQQSDAEAQEWRRLIQQAIIARRKQATVRGGSRLGPSSASGSRRTSASDIRKPAEALDATAAVAQQLRDIDSVMNEEMNTLLHLYLSKRTAVLDEMMGREIWRIKQAGQKKREQIEAVLRKRETQ